MKNNNTNNLPVGDGELERENNHLGSSEFIQMKKLQLTNINKNNQPIGDGDHENENNHQGKPSLFELKKLETYCNADYCLSCAYFQQTKGNFGRCMVLKNDKKYDGSKKGSGCTAWRLNKELIDIVYCAPVKQKGNGWINKLRQEFNQKRKAEITRLRELRKENIMMEKRFEGKSQFTKINTDYIQRLPYAQTSDVHSFKRAYYKKKFNKRVIEYAIKLMTENKTLSSRQIAIDINKKFDIKITHQTIIDWSIQFKLNRKFDLKNGAHRPEVNNAISNGVSMYFKVKNMSIIPQEIKDKILQLFFSDLSLRQIAKTIEKENKMKLTISKIYTTLQKEVKEELISVKDPSMFNRQKLIKTWVYNK